MQFSRKHLVLSLVGLAIVVGVGAGVWGVMHRNPYKNLVTHIEVQTDDATRTLAAQRIATAQASLAATQSAGQEIDLALYGSIANDALILGDLVLARESLEAQLAGNSLSYAVWNSYGYVLSLMQDYDLAKTAYLRAVELSPQEGYYRDAIRFLEKQFPDDRALVLALYEDSVEQLGRMTFNMIGLGDWYAQAGDCTRAKDHYDVAEDLSDNADIRMQIKTDAARALEECRVLAGKPTGEGKEIQE